MRQSVFFPMSAAATAAVLVGSSLLVPFGAASLEARQSQSGVVAPGAPYVDPARCGSLPGIITRMKAGLPQQRDWIEKTEMQLRAAREGKLSSEAERRNFFMKTAIGFSTKIVQQVATLRRSLEALHALSPAQASIRLTLLKQLETLIKGADEFNKALARGEAIANYRQMVQKQMADVRQFVIMINDSGIADDLASWASNLAIPVAGPLAVEAFTVLRDFAFAELQLTFTEDELRRHETNLQEMKNALRNNEFLVRDLEAEHTVCSRPKPDEQKPESRPEQAEPVVGQPAPGAAASPKKGAGAGTAVMIGLLAGLGVAGYVGYEEYMKSQEEGGGDPGGTSGGMTFVSGSFSCRFNSGGVVSSCADSVITVNITRQMPVGSQLKLLTNHIQSVGTVPTTRNPPGNVTFRGFSGGGWFDACGPNVTRLNLLNTSVSSSVVVTSVTGLSMPVTCR